MTGNCVQEFEKEILRTNLEPVRETIGGENRESIPKKLFARDDFEFENDIDEQIAFDDSFEENPNPLDDVAFFFLINQG